VSLRNLFAAVGFAGSLAWAQSANADIISISFDGINTAASGTNTVQAAISQGATSSILVSAGQPGGTCCFAGALFGMLDSNVIAMNTTGTVNVWVTNQGLDFGFRPSFVSDAVSTFTTNALPPGWVVTESTFVSRQNALFTGDLVASTVFTGPLPSGATDRADTFCQVGGGPLPTD